MSYGWCLAVVKVPLHNTVTLLVEVPCYEPTSGGDRCYWHGGDR